MWFPQNGRAARATERPLVVAVSFAAVWLKNGPSY
jgi:hypothetical protein